MTRTIIGIDLGTTYSLVAVLQGDRPTVLPNAIGELLTPSAVSLADDGTVLVGAAARARATTHPTRTALSFKRDMGTDRKIALGDRAFSPQELSALVLGAVKRDAEAALGRTVDEAVVTVPAYFGDAQRQATRDAGAIAGLSVERIINEPTAAALAYGLHERHRELRTVVIDLGGGTFDVTVLEILEGVIEIQASAGDTRLGGDDFDLALAELVVDSLDSGLRGAVRGHPQAWARIKDACEAAKKRLSEADAARVVLVDLPAGDRAIQLELPVSRERAEQAWQPLLERMKLPILRALRDASVRPEQIDEVLVVGGSTRMPCIAKLAAQMFGRLPLRTLPPDEAIALGAAVQAGLKAGDAALGDMVVTDVAPFSLGINTGERLGRASIGGLFTPIIERGTVIPTSREQTFSTLEDGQRVISFGVYQGEHSLVRDNTKLADYTIRGLAPLPAGQQSVRVRFTYDLNGILEVDTTVVATGKTESFVIEGSTRRLTPQQLKEARDAMARLKFHPPRDAAQRDLARARRRAARRADRRAAADPARGDHAVPAGARGPGRAADRAGPRAPRPPARRAASLTAASWRQCAAHRVQNRWGRPPRRERRRHAASLRARWEIRRVRIVVPPPPAAPTYPVMGKSPLIELVDIARYHQMGEERIAALDGVSFTVERGDMVAIVGSSGSGKTTLLNLLGCLDTPSRGRYRLDGHDVQDLSDDARARLRNREIGFVFQSFQLLHRATALRNVALPLIYQGVAARERDARARDALARVGLAARCAHRPAQLSGGQRQRTAIARALVTRPSLLLCDEPTGNLDSATTDDVMALFHQLHAEGNTILIVTHEPAIAARCPRVIRLLDGKLVHDGPGAPPHAPPGGPPPDAARLAAHGAAA
jgi:molecular chaperone HscC